MGVLPEKVVKKCLWATGRKDPDYENILPLAPSKGGHIERFQTVPYVIALTNGNARNEKTSTSVTT